MTDKHDPTCDIPSCPNPDTGCCHCTCELPMGIDTWLLHGQKHGYSDYAVMEQRERFDRDMAYMFANAPETYHEIKSKIYRA